MSLAEVLDGIEHDSRCDHVHQSCDYCARPSAAVLRAPSPDYTLKEWAVRHHGIVSFFVSPDSQWGRPFRCELVIDGAHDHTVTGDNWEDVTARAAELVTRNPGLDPEDSPEP